MRKLIPILALSLAFTSVLIFAAQHTRFTNPVHLKIYDELVKAEYRINKERPAGMDDILLVTIDSETLEKMPERWPYQRSTFAKAIENLKNAGAKAIGFDFIFYGRSTDEDDAALKKALGEGSDIILGAAIDERGRLRTSTAPALKDSAVSGFVTKLQDPDGVTRKALTYLVSQQEGGLGHLSWEIELLKTAEGIDISAMESTSSYIYLRNNKGRTWRIPVEADTKSFLINFRGHTTDFRQLSFLRAVRGEFDPAAVKGKIVLIGFASILFQDLHKTPIGWVPGLTLNANAFLTLYSGDFLKPLRKRFEIPFVIIGVILASVFVSILKNRTALLLIAIEICIFFAAGEMLLIKGWVIQDYSTFPIAVLACPVLSKKLMDIINRIWLNKR